MEKRQQSPALTYSDVKGVCDRLHASGEKVSGNRVIAELGRGSKGTALGFVKQWREELEASQAHLMESMGFSDSFADSFMKEMGRFQVAIESRFEDTLTASKTLETEALTALTEAEKKIEMLQADVDKRDQAIADLNEKSTASKSSWLSTEKELREQLDDRGRLLREGREQIDRLTTELAKAEMRLEDSGKLVSEANTNRDQLRLDLTEVRSKLTQAETQNATITAQNEAIRESLEVERSNHKETKERVDALNNRLSQAEQRNTKMEVEAQAAVQLKERLATTEAKLESATNSLDAEKKTHSETRGLINQLQERLLKSEKGLARLESVSAALDTEKKAHAVTTETRSKLEADLTTEREKHDSTKQKLAQAQAEGLLDKKK
ncbi:DNA-binding protein [Vibrio splendidus]|uniref:KfrA N-terminal DNA-binding domain-containing protein n=1 Tax=Vibrio splendidus TaxID=29497 RepID=A0A2T5EJU3_VIBSP|nr:DNA-binding protein [Vibrio splendidus]EHY9845485.1 DNA-binding protein [Vibrio cholerae]OEE59633.1 hypothetical protein A147_00545 [Vibrio splendidus FF-6]PTP20518.1 hypothetical protein CWO36_08325 [Vibrio splendidus]